MVRDDGWREQQVIQNIDAGQVVYIFRISSDLVEVRRLPWSSTIVFDIGDASLRDRVIEQENPRARRDGFQIL